MYKKIILSLLVIFLLLNFTLFAQNTDADAGAKSREKTEENISGEAAQANSYNEDGNNSTSAESKTFSLWEFYKQGGIFMWPVLVITAFGFAIVIERVIAFARARLASKEFIDQLEKSISEKDLESIETLCKQKKNKLAGIIEKGLALKHLGYERVEKTFSVAASVEVASLERHLGIISAMANIAPMLGFLGTVTGMVTAFNDIAAADQVSAKIVAGGIREALLTTVFGLVAAIPLLLLYNYFVNKIEGFVTSVERISSDVIEKLIKGNGY